MYWCSCKAKTETVCPQQSKQKGKGKKRKVERGRVTRGVTMRLKMQLLRNVHARTYLGVRIGLVGFPGRYESLIAF